MKPRRSSAARPNASSGTSRRFVVTGIVEEKETGRALSELVVRAFDKDLLFDDALGYASTGTDGRFTIRFQSERFRDLRELRPDLFLRIYDPQGVRMLHETSDAIRWNAALREDYRVRIPAALASLR